MVDTKYKDHRFYASKYKEHPSGLEWIGVALVLIGTALSLLVVAQRIIMGYYGVGLVLVAVGSVLMFHKTIKEEPESEPVQEIKKLSKIKTMLAGVLVFLAIMGVMVFTLGTTGRFGILYTGRGFVGAVVCMGVAMGLLGIGGGTNEDND